MPLMNWKIASFCMVISAVLLLTSYTTRLQYHVSIKNSQLWQSVDPQAPFNITDFRQRAVNILYNRVPKCGSSTTGRVMKQTAVDRNQRRYHYDTVFTRYNTTSEDDISAFTRWYSQCPRGCLVNIQKYYVDFSVAPFANFSPPVYINLVREQLGRQLSYYNYIRFVNEAGNVVTDAMRNVTFDECVSRRLAECVDNTTNTHLVAFLCGMDAVCRKRGHGSLQRAKRNIVTQYAIVGYLESIAEFYRALEMMFPVWFEDMSQIYADMREKKQQWVNQNQKGNKTVSLPNVATMKSVLWADYELYFYIKQRFHFTLQALENELLMINAHK